MKNSKVKLLSVWCVVIMVATVFSVAITNVAAQKNSEKRIESPNPDVAIDRYTHIVWQENLTENFEIHYTNNAAIGNYEKTLGSMKKDLESFKEPEAKKALKNLDEALEKCLEKDYKHAIDRTHEAIKNLEKVNRTETTNILKALIDSIRDFAKTNLLYVEYDLSFSNSYVQEAWCKYYLAIKKYAESNYDAATMQFKNSYLKLVEGYEAIGKSFTGHDFGKIVRVSYTNYDSVNPQIFLNDGTVNVGWKEIMDTRPHVDYAKSINDGITWWYFDATEQASTYLCYVGIDPYTVTIENTINIVRALERIWIIDGCHFFYAPIARDGFTIEDRKVFAPLNDPYLELYAGRYEIIYIGERKLYLICGPGPLPVPPPRAPDLTIASISFLTGIPKEGEQINISVTIKNEGDANTSGTIPVKLFDSNIEIGKIDVSSLQINETKSVQFSGALSPGNRVITATIDPDNILAEGNESNNNLEDRLFILYKWMGVGNYFEFMTNIVSVINGTENASIVKCAIEIAGVTSATMLIKEIYSSNETKFSLNTTYSLTTRKEPRENFSAWLWINNDDLTRGYIQVGYETLTYINTTENYHVFEWSQPPKNKSTFYYSKTDNCLALAEEYRITQNQEGRNIIVNTTSIRSESGFRERLPEKIDIITEKSSEERVPRSEYSQTLDKASSNSEVIIFSDNINTLSAWTVVGTGGTSALFTDEMDSLSAWTVSGASTTSPIFTSYVENLLWCDVSGQVTTTTVFSDSFSSLSDWSVTPSVLFSDNFNDGIADGWTPTGGTWTVENGEYSQSNKDVDVYSFAGSIDWKNYIYEARVIIKEKKYSTSWVSLTYGVLDENNLYTFTIRDGYYWVGYRKEGEWYNGWIAKSDIDVDIWNTMKIKFTSETITAWLNDELLGSYSYPTSFRTSGKIGFRCWAAYAHFDDVIVKEEWSLSSAQYYSSPYSVKCTQNPEYGNNIDTYLTRSVSLGGYTSVTLSFYIWLFTEVYYDYIYVQAYYNGCWNTLWSRAGVYNWWEQRSVNVPTSSTAIRFWFHSDYSGAFEGVYIDNVVLTGTVGEQWSISSARYYIGSYSAKCTPLSNYGNNVDTAMTMSVSLGSYSSAKLSFYIWQDTETNYDYIQVQYYSSGSWSTAWSRSGHYNSWEQKSVTIPNTATKIRFRFYSDSSVTYEGVYIDYVILEGIYSTEQWSLSTKYHDSPYSAKCTQYSTYGNNLDTTLTVGVSLSDYISATLSFWIWQETEQNYDFVQVQYYSSGVWATVWSRSGPYRWWEQISVSIPTSAIHIRFRFYSDSSVTYEGVYIDYVQLVVTGEGWSLSSDRYYSSPYSVKCTAESTYGCDADTTMTRSVSLSGYGYAELSFWIWQDTVPNCDFIQVQYYSEGSWNTAWSRAGSYKSWEQVTLGMSNSVTKIRFRFYSTFGGYEGVYIDDVMLVAYQAELYFDPPYEKGDIDKASDGWGVWSPDHGGTCDANTGKMHCYAKVSSAGLGGGMSWARAWLYGPDIGSFNVAESGTYKVSMYFSYKEEGGGSVISSVILGQGKYVCAARVIGTIIDLTSGETKTKIYVLAYHTAMLGIEGWKDSGAFYFAFSVPLDPTHSYKFYIALEVWAKTATVGAAYAKGEEAVTMTSNYVVLEKI